MSNCLQQTSDGATPEPAYARRFAEYFRRHGTPCELFHGALWIESQRTIHPVGASSANYSLTKSQARHLLSRLKGGLFVICTDGFQPESGSEWHVMIARRFVDLARLDSRVRYEVRRGLRECVVEKVDAQRVANEGYDTYAAAVHRYTRGRQKPPKSPEKFYNSILVAGEFADVIDFWAVFREGKMVGFAQNQRCAREEIAYDGMTFHPGFFRFNTSYALIYTMNEYYLVQENFDHLSCGFRTVLHETEFQKFLSKQLQLERMPTNLYIHYRFPIGAVMALPGPVRALLSRWSAKFAAVNQMHSFRANRRLPLSSQ